MCSEDDLIRPFLEEFIQRRTRINFKIQSDLARIYKLPGYCGSLPLHVHVDNPESVDEAIDSTTDDILEMAIDAVVDSIENLADDE